MGVLSKARRRIETLLAWLVALLVVGLIAAGAWYLWTVVA